MMHAGNSYYRQFGFRRFGYYWPGVQETRLPA